MEKKEQLYEGKAKKVYATEDPNLVDGVAKRYLIQNEAGDLAPMGAEAVSVASDTEVTEMFNEVFGSEA